MREPTLLDIALKATAIQYERQVRNDQEKRDQVIRLLAQAADASIEDLERHLVIREADGDCRFWLRRVGGRRKVYVVADHHQVHSYYRSGLAAHWGGAPITAADALLRLAR